MVQAGKAVGLATIALRGNNARCRAPSAAGHLCFIIVPKRVELVAPVGSTVEVSRDERFPPRCGSRAAGPPRGGEACSAVRGIQTTHGLFLSCARLCFRNVKSTFELSALPCPIRRRRGPQSSRPRRCGRVRHVSKMLRALRRRDRRGGECFAGKRFFDGPGPAARARQRGPPCGWPPCRSCLLRCAQPLASGSSGVPEPDGFSEPADLSDAAFSAFASWPAATAAGSRPGRKIESWCCGRSLAST